MTNARSVVHTRHFRTDIRGMYVRRTIRDRRRDNVGRTDDPPSGPSSPVPLIHVAPTHCPCTASPPLSHPSTLRMFLVPCSLFLAPCVVMPRPFRGSGRPSKGPSRPVDRPDATMSDGNGIQELLKAEKKAEEIVAKARAARQQKLKVRRAWCDGGDGLAVRQRRVEALMQANQ